VQENKVINNNNLIRSSHNTAKISPRKVQIVANSIRGKGVLEVLNVLRFQNKKAAGIILQVVKSGVANAKNGKDIDSSNLYLKDILIGPGQTFKKGRIEAKGRFKPIKKRTTNITVLLDSKADSSNKSELKKESKVE
jgi:large subunit ribosomal protein L22